MKRKQLEHAPFVGAGAAEGREERVVVGVHMHPEKCAHDKTTQTKQNKTKKQRAKTAGRVPVVGVQQMA